MDDSNFMSGFVTGDAMGRNNNCNNGWGNGAFGMEWLFALLILPMMWGGGGFFGNRGNGDGVTNADLCMNTSFSELKNSVGRLSDVTQQGISTLGYESLNQTMGLQRDLCTGLNSVVAAINAAAAQQAQCCCDTKQLLMENRYLAERNAANSDAVTVAQTQKILDAICGNRMADMQNQINQLQLSQALCGVPRFQPGTVYGAVPANPFFGSWGNLGGCCGNNNI